MIRSISPHAYETMRKNAMTITPMPCKSLLLKKMSHFRCAPGMQMELFNLLKLKLSTEDNWTAQSVISFDEMQLQEKFKYCGRLERFFKNHKKIQDVLLREIINN